MKRKSKQEITQQDVSAALATFLKHGGMIRQLPAQRFQSAGTVGGEKYQAYESITDLPVIAEVTERVA
jgi:hypothetical protein